MVKEFTDFPNVGIMQPGDLPVGTRAGQNAQFDFPGTGIQDAYGNFLIGWGTVGASAVNYLQTINAISGQSPGFTTAGMDANIGINFSPKGNGGIGFNTSDGANFSYVNTGVGNVDFSFGGYFSLNGTQGVNGISNDPNLTADSAMLIPTQQAVKSYVDDSGSFLASLTYITNVDETEHLPNSRVLTGTEHQIVVTNGVLSLPSDLLLPGDLQVNGDLELASSGFLFSESDIQIIAAMGGGAGDLDLLVNGTGSLGLQTDSGDITLETSSGNQSFIIGASTLIDLNVSGIRFGGSGARVTSISDDTTMSADSSTLSVTQHAAKTYSDSVGGGAVTLTNAGIASGTQSAVSDGTGPSLSVKGFVGANGLTTSSNGTDLTIGINASSSSAGKMLRATGSTWDASTATFANTYNQYDLLMASSANTVTGLAKAQNSVLTTDLLSSPTWVNLGSFQFIGGASNGPKPYRIAVGNGMAATYDSSITPGVITVELEPPVSIANGGTNTTSAIGANGTLAQSNGTQYTFTTATYPTTAGTAGNIITSDGTNFISSAPAVVPLTFNTVTTSTQSLAINNAYYTTYAGLSTMPLPTTAPVGSIIEVYAGPSGSTFRISQNSGQYIYYGAQSGTLIVSATGTGGYVQSVDPATSVRLVCVVTNVGWMVVSNVNNLQVNT